MSNIKLLTYNVWWYCTSGKKGPACPIGVAKTIQNNGPYDFINLQEASSYADLHDHAPLLESMEHVAIKEKEQLVTYYDGSKYTLKNQFSGDLDGNGHPYLVLVFNEGIVLLNVHPGHGGYQNTMKQIESIFTKHQLHTLYPNHRFIMSGDFNTPMRDNSYVFDSVNMYISDQLESCCIPDMNSGPAVTDQDIKDFPPYSKKYDHIFDTHSKPTNYIPQIVRPAADHAPVVGLLGTSSFKSSAIPSDALEVGGESVGLFWFIILAFVFFLFALVLFL